MYIARLFLFSVLLTVVGCKPPDYAPVSRVELEVSRTHVFEGVTSQEFFEAVEQVLQLADREDFSFEFEGDSLVATRMRGGDYRDTWTFDAIETSSGIQASAYLHSYYETAAGKQFNDHNGSVPVYETLWSRVGFMLGVTNSWITCDQLEDRVDDEPDPARRNIGGLCDRGLDDETPE